MASKIPVFLLRIAAVLSLAVSATATNATNATSSGYSDDPYLAFRPAFARSLPVQILLTGIVLTLVAVLFIHLIFTGQYHWPLAPVNYVLQISGVTTLLISLIATLHVVLSATINESRSWPYMLSYVAVNVPPQDTGNTDPNTWSTAERATWLVMNASTSGLIQITHIQFLTLLYPSRVERRLIFALLGPLALVAAVMQLIPIGSNLKVNQFASAVRNVCNATLSLLFTVALFIWGFLVKRKEAWRTDGGTAAFGCAALLLAIASTGLNFLYVPREEEYMWLPGLMWAVVLWQSFLGWWWWVGAGSEPAVDTEETARAARREAKRALRKKEARERRRETKARAKVVWRGVAGAFGSRQRSGAGVVHSAPDSGSEPAHDSGSSEPPSPTAPEAPGSATSTASLSSSTTISPLPQFFPEFMHRWYISVRHAHMLAARQQAAERVERILELERTDVARSGWGLGSFAWRLKRRESSGHEEDDDDYELEVPHPRRKETDDDGEDEEEEIRTIPPAVVHPPPVAVRPQGRWLWGPLGRWRLRDSTLY